MFLFFDFETAVGVGVFISKTNVMKDNKEYDVDEAWRREEPSDVDDCLKRLVELSTSDKKVECHGASMLEYDGKFSIRPKFDIRFSENDKNKKSDKKRKEKQKKKEKELIQSFREKAFPFLPPEARRFIDVARFKWNTYYNTGTLFIGRHYRLPTRCIDWTTDPFIALFFACCNDTNEPGVIWWMDYKNFSHAIAMQWPYFYNKYEQVEEDFEKNFKNGRNEDILIRYHYHCLLDRPQKQKAHIILSGEYDVHHDKAIHRLGVRKCGRIVIRSEIKQNLLDKLTLWGINKTTLAIEDSYLEKIARQVADEVLGSEKSKKAK